MAFTGGSLGSGQVATTWGAIYTVPASKVAIIKSIELYNTGSATQTVDVAITRSGQTRRQIRKLTLLANESASLLSAGDTFVLSAADTFDAQTTTTTTVNYVVMGATE